MGTKVLEKTRMCVYLTNGGTCRHGPSCLFAHDISELRAAPSLEKTKMCPRLKNGCDGVLCGGSYAHDRSELRSTTDLFKTSMCKFFQQGHCSMGSNCRFAHGTDELRSPQFEMAFDIAEKASLAPTPPGFSDSPRTSSGSPVNIEDHSMMDIEQPGALLSTLDGIDLSVFGFSAEELRHALEMALDLANAESFTSDANTPTSVCGSSTGSIELDTPVPEYKLWSNRRRLSFIATHLHQRRNSRVPFESESAVNTSAEHTDTDYSVKEDLQALIKLIG